MTTLKELADARTLVKREIRKQLSAILDTPLVGHIIYFDELLFHEPLIDGLKKISERHDRVGETFNYNSDFSGRFFGWRDAVDQVIDWLEREGKPYRLLWDLQASLQPESIGVFPENPIAQLDELMSKTFPKDNL